MSFNQPPASEKNLFGKMKSEWKQTVASLFTLATSLYIGNIASVDAKAFNPENKTEPTTEIVQKITQKKDQGRFTKELIFDIEKIVRYFYRSKYEKLNGNLKEIEAWEKEAFKTLSDLLNRGLITKDEAKMIVEESTDFTIEFESDKSDKEKIDLVKRNKTETDQIELTDQNLIAEKGVEKDLEKELGNGFRNISQENSAEQDQILESKINSLTAQENLANLKTTSQVKTEFDLVKNKKATKPVEIIRDSYQAPVSKNLKEVDSKIEVSYVPVSSTNVDVKVQTSGAGVVGDVLNGVFGGRGNNGIIPNILEQAVPKVLNEVINPKKGIGNGSDNNSSKDSQTGQAENKANQSQSQNSQSDIIPLPAETSNNPLLNDLSNQIPNQSSNQSTKDSSFNNSKPQKNNNSLNQGQGSDTKDLKPKLNLQQNNNSTPVKPSAKPVSKPTSKKEVSKPAINQEKKPTQPVQPVPPTEPQKPVQKPAPISVEGSKKQAQKESLSSSTIVIPLDQSGKTNTGDITKDREVAPVLNLRLGAFVPTELAQKAVVFSDLGSFTNSAGVRIDRKLLQIADGDNLRLAVQLIDPTGNSGGVYFIGNVQELFNNGNLTLNPYTIKDGQRIELGQVVISGQDLNGLNNGGVVNLKELVSKNAPAGSDLANLKTPKVFNDQELIVAKTKFNNNPKTALEVLNANYGEIISNIAFLRGPAVNLENQTTINRLLAQGNLDLGAFGRVLIEDLQINSVNNPEKATELLALMDIVLENGGIFSVSQTSSEYAIARNLVGLRMVLAENGLVKGVNLSDLLKTPQGREQALAILTANDRGTVLDDKNPAMEYIQSRPSANNHKLPETNLDGEQKYPRKISEMVGALNQNMANRGINEKWLMEGNRAFLVNEKGDKIGVISISSFERFTFNPLALVPFVNQVVGIVNVLGGITGQGNLINFDALFSATSQTNIVAGRFNDLDIVKQIVDNGGLRKILENTNGFNLLPPLFQELVELNAQAQVLSGGNINPLGDFLTLKIGNLSLSGGFSSSSSESVLASDFVDLKTMQAIVDAETILTQKYDQSQKLAQKGLTKSQIVATLIGEDGQATDGQRVKRVVQALEFVAKANLQAKTGTSVSPVLLTIKERAIGLSSLNAQNIDKTKYSQEFLEKLEIAQKQLQNQIGNAILPRDGAKNLLLKKGLPANSVEQVLDALADRKIGAVGSTGVIIESGSPEKFGFVKDNDGKYIIVQAFGNKTNGNLTVFSGLISNLVKLSGINLNGQRIAILNSECIFNPVESITVQPPVVLPEQLGVKAGAEFCIPSGEVYSTDFSMNDKYSLLSPVNALKAELYTNPENSGTSQDNAMALRRLIEQAQDNSQGNELSSIQGTASTTNRINNLGFGSYGTAGGDTFYGFGSITSGDRGRVELGTAQRVVSEGDCGEQKLNILKQATVAQSRSNFNLDLSFRNFVSKPPEPPTLPVPPVVPTPPVIPPAPQPPVISTPPPEPPTLPVPPVVPTPPVIPPAPQPPVISTPPPEPPTLPVPPVVPTPPVIPPAPQPPVISTPPPEPPKPPEPPVVPTPPVIPPAPQPPVISTPPPEPPKPPEPPVVPTPPVIPPAPQPPVISTPPPEPPKPPEPPVVPTPPVVPPAPQPPVISTPPPVVPIVPPNIVPQPPVVPPAPQPPVISTPPPVVPIVPPNIVPQPPVIPPIPQPQPIPQPIPPVVPPPVVGIPPVQPKPPIPQPQPIPQPIPPVVPPPVVGIPPVQPKPPTTIPPVNPTPTPPVVPPPVVGIPPVQPKPPTTIPPVNPTPTPPVVPPPVVVIPPVQPKPPTTIPPVNPTPTPPVVPPPGGSTPVQSQPQPKFGVGAPIIVRPVPPIAQPPTR